MKISLITVTFNSGVTIRTTIESILSQDYQDFEYIIIDGASRDNTLDIIREYEPRFGDRIRIVSEPDGGIYDALNKGISLSTGDIIGILHGDDVLAGNDILRCMGEEFSKTGCSVLYGNLTYINKDDEVVRAWKSCHFNRKLLQKGWMPPHPTLYVKKELFDTVGKYSLDYRISADYDFMLRILKQTPVDKIAYLDKLIVKMHIGGVSNNGLKNIRCKMKEDLAILRKNEVGGIYALMHKNASKITQFVNKDRDSKKMRKKKKTSSISGLFLPLNNYFNAKVLRRRRK